MSETLTINSLLDSTELTAGKRYAIQGIAAEYLTKACVLGDVLENRTPVDQFTDHRDHIETVDPFAEAIAKTRMMLVAGGMIDPGDELVRQELTERSEDS